MTSRDLTENVEQLQILESLRVIRDDLVALIARLADLADRHKATVMVARTHNVVAQATTLGKRFADAVSESLLAYERISGLLERYPLRGIKGAVGTQLDQLDLLASPSAVDELDQLIADHLGFENVLAACGQVYPALARPRCGGGSSAVCLRGCLVGYDSALDGRSRSRV